MPYTEAHQLLTVFGTSFTSEETWSFGIRCIGQGSVVSQSAADAVRGAVTTFWNTAGIFMPSSHTLEGVKLAPIGTDGKYPVGQIAYIGDIVSDGGPSTTNIHPAQCAQVATFLSATIPRGRGSRGRIYLPCPGAAVSATTGENGLALAIATAVRDLLVAIDGTALMGTPAIMSELGTGTTSAIGSVRADNLPDTQRRRRRQLVSVTETVVV